MISRIRDLTHIPRPEGKDLVLAFDVIGGIGPMPSDTVRADPEDVGYFGTRVVLMELLSLGAEPLLVADLLTLPWPDLGERVVAGMRALLREAGFAELPVTGSTEDNVQALATGAGFVGVGEVEAASIRHNLARAGDLLYLLGRPKSAPEDAVRPGDPEMMNPGRLRRLMQDRHVHEVLPLGSGGLSRELSELGARGLRPELAQDLPQGILSRSGGPATAVLLAADPAWPLQAAVGVPLLPLGRLTQGS